MNVLTHPFTVWFQEIKAGFEFSVGKNLINCLAIHLGIKSKQKAVLIYGRKNTKSCNEKVIEKK